MKKKYLIKSPVRFMVFIITIMMLMVLVTGLIGVSNQSESLTKDVYHEIQIIPGDTLWELAKDYGPDDEDIRKVIHAICTINNIKPNEIQPGQSILIPQYL